MRSLALLFLAVLMLAQPARAQVEREDTGGFIDRLLERSLSGDNRAVRVIGLSGALSSRATVEQITVADEDGVWLTIDNAELDWTRSALLRGNLTIDTLSAERIEVARRPGVIPADPDLPTPAATPFRVPELPVALSIGNLSVAELVIGEPVMGLAATLKVDGRLSLDAGALDTDLDIVRTDRPGDSIGITAAFNNQSRDLTIDLSVTEDAGGLVSELLSIPDRPSVDLSVKGQGPLDAFTADIRLATAGEERVSGQVSLDGIEGGEGLRFSADVGGDLRPILAERFREFFGTDTRLKASGTKAPDGSLTLPEMSLVTGALDLTGAVALAADGKVASFDVSGSITPQEGGEVTLPLSGPVTTIRGAQLSATFDASSGNDWTLDTTVDGLTRPDFSAERAEIQGRGTLDQSEGTSVTGDLTAALQGLDFSDQGLREAVGSEVQLTGGFDWTGGVLTLTEFLLDGTDYSAGLDGKVDGFQTGFAVDGSANLTADDLSRFSALANRPLTGSINAQIEGSGTPLGGKFDFSLNGDAQDLSAGIAQVDPLIGGATTLTLDAERDETGTRINTFTLNGEALTAEASGVIENLQSQFTFRAELDDLGRVVPQAPGPVTLSGDVGHDGSVLTGEVTLDAPGGTGARITGTVTDAFAVDVDYAATITGIERFVEQISGDLSASGNATRTEDGSWQVGAQTSGTAGIDGQFQAGFTEETGDLELDFNAAFARLERVVPQISGDLNARGEATRSGDSVWQVRAQTGGTAGIEGQVTATFDQKTGELDAETDATFRRLERLVPQLTGDVSAQATASRSAAQEWSVSATTSGSAGIEGDFDGTFDERTGALALTYDAGLARLERVVPQLPGTIRAEGRVARSEELVWTLDTTAGGTVGLTGDFRGRFDQTSGAAELTFDAAFDRLQRFVAPLAGSVTAKGTASRSEERAWTAKLETGGTAGISGTFDVAYDEVSTDAKASFDAALSGLGRLVPEIGGTLTARGEAERSGSNWTIDARAEGPAGINANVAGSFDQAANRADVTAQGQANLALANAFISPNSLRGPVRFDLALRGAPALTSLSGTVSASGATFALPSVPLTLQNINANVQLSNGRANVTVTGNPRPAGQFRVTGPVDLSAPFNAGLNIDLLGVTLTDNLSYTTTANGQLRLAGALTGGANLTGAITFGETEFNIATASGSFGAAPIPEIRFVGETAPERRTRAAAGLLEQSSGGGPVYGLDLRLNAPRRIFVRGRGLDAELGGSVTIRGTTANPIPAGDISLIRGHFDILGRRLDLDQGTITLAGGFTPFINLTATTSTSEGQATLSISGPANAPKIEVTAVPDRPSEEALALLLFGNRFENLSALQLAQLAAQVATLSGQGGGLLDRIRKGLGFDNLDFGTDASGNASVGAGAYLSDNLYTNVTVNQKGETEVNLNLDITDTLTLRGSATSEGNTGFGLFYEKDY